MNLSLDGAQNSNDDKVDKYKKGGMLENDETSAEGVTSKTTQTYQDVGVRNISAPAKTAQNTAKLFNSSRKADITTKRNYGILNGNNHVSTSSLDLLISLVIAILRYVGGVADNFSTRHIMAAERLLRLLMLKTVNG